MSKIKNAVIVITGASSGLGRAAAYALAKKGAKLVLAARQESVLRDVVRECQELGGEAVAVPTDVTQEEEVKNLARLAVETFGRLDVWVNNASVALFSKFDEAPSEDVRRVVETNILGYVYGAQSALQRFRQQGHGTLVNVASLMAEASQPYWSAYTMSKAAVRALGDCLRMELILDGGHDIHVATVMPASLDTPFFQHAANYSRREVQPIPPVYPVDRAVAAIVAAIERPRREVSTGGVAPWVMVWKRLTPSLYEHVMARHLQKTQAGADYAPAKTGNLFRPMPEETGTSGGWRSSSGSALNLVALAGVAIAVPVAMMWLMGGRPRGESAVAALGRMGRQAADENLPISSYQAAASPLTC